MATITEEMIACAEQLRRMTESAGLRCARAVVRVGDGRLPLALEAEDPEGNRHDYYRGRPPEAGGADD